MTSNNSTRRMRAYGDQSMLPKDSDVGTGRILIPTSDVVQDSAPDGLGGLRIDTDGELYIRPYGGEESQVAMNVPNIDMITVSAGSDFTSVYEALASLEGSTTTAWIKVYGVVGELSAYDASGIDSDTLVVIDLRQPTAVWNISQDLINGDFEMVVLGPGHMVDADPQRKTAIMTGSFRPGSGVTLNITNFTVQDAYVYYISSFSTPEIVCDSLRLLNVRSNYVDFDCSAGSNVTIHQSFIDIGDVLVHPTLSLLSIMYSYVNTLTSSAPLTVTNGREFCFNSFVNLTNITINSGNVNIQNGVLIP